MAKRVTELLPALENQQRLVRRDRRRAEWDGDLPQRGRYQGDGVGRTCGVGLGLGVVLGVGVAVGVTVGVGLTVAVGVAVGVGVGVGDCS